MSSIILAWKSHEQEGLGPGERAEPDFHEDQRNHEPVEAGFCGEAVAASRGDAPEVESYEALGACL
jgi:hypothetical protein